MSTTVEEVQAKLSMDVSTLGRAKRELAEFNAGGHAGFLHHTNGAREFHKSIHNLTEQVPGLGIAFQALMSPIGATMTAATMAFTYAKEKLAEWNAEMDKTAERNAKAVFGADALRAVGVEQAKMQDEFASFMHRREDAAKRYLESVEVEQEKGKENLENDKKRLALKKEMAEEIIRTQVENGSMSASAGMMASLALGKTSQHEERGLEQNALNDRADALRRAWASAAENSIQAKMSASELQDPLEKNVMDLGRSEGMLHTAEEREKAAKETRDAAEKQARDIPWSGQYSGVTKENEAKADAALQAWRKEKDILDKRQDAVAALKVEQDKLNKSYRDAKEKVTQWQGALENIESQSRKVAAEQRKLQNSPLGAVRPGEFSSPDTFSTSELAGYNTKYGSVARRIQEVEGKAREASAGGHQDLADSIREKGVWEDNFKPWAGWDDNATRGKGVKDLYNLLPKGMTKEQQGADRSKAMIDSILESLSGNSKAVSVKVVSMSNGE